MKKYVIAALGVLIAGQAVARDQLKIVGSSTVYPFSSYVAEEFGSVTRYQIPVVESTGTGGGMKLFCAGNELSTPDIVNASRRMKIKEMELCQRNGVKEITEIMFGYDGIVIAQSNTNKVINLSKHDLLLAVAKLVPNKEETALIDNPYMYWDEINAELPHRKITIYGPPVSSGTRDAFEEIVMEYQTDEMKVYRDTGNKGYRIIRTDGVYIPSGENDNLIVQKLSKDKDAVGIFGYSFLEENTDSINAVLVNSIAPTSENIASKKYPIARSLYFYAKNSHMDKVEGMQEYMEMFLDEEIVGKEGLLSEIGLIPLTHEMLMAEQKKLGDMQKLTVGALEAAIAD